MRNFCRPVDPSFRPAALICVSYGLLGLGMVLQPARYAAIPAYGNLTDVIAMQVWGALHLAVAVSFGLYTLLAIPRHLALGAHIYGLILTGYWLMAFIIRWFTDTATTSANVATWLVLLCVMGRSAALIPRARRPAAP